MDYPKNRDLVASPWLAPWEQEEVIKAMLHFEILNWDNRRTLPLKKGGTTDVYVNLRQARNYPEAMRFFARMFANPLSRLGVNRIAEVPQAVTCFSGLIAEAINRPLVTIREEPKGGRVSAADIIGNIKYGELIGLYDDVITDGASKLPGYCAINRRGATPILVVAVDRDQGWRETFAKAEVNMPVWAGMSLHDIRAHLIGNRLMERCDPSVEEKNPIILALDGKSWEEILPIVDRLRPTGTILKVNDIAMGLGVDTIVPKLQVYGRVMVDLKAHDVPPTVENICRRVAKYNPWACTIHASGGAAMVKAALRGFEGTDTIVLAVTVLTSLKDECEEIFTRMPLDQVKVLAKIVWDAGARGFVCSPEEASPLREMFPDATIVTPGVRSPGVDHGTQKRVATPAVAIGRGANYIVGGTQFLTAPDPAAEIERVLRDELRVNLT